MKNKQTYDLLKPIVDTIDKAIVCQTLTDNGNGTFTFTCNNTKWLTKGYSFTVITDVYKVVSIVPNVSITVSGSTLPLAKTFDIYLPYFIHGTVIATNAELQNTANSIDKLPFIWLKEVTKETVSVDELDSLDRVSECDLYFMVDCDFSNWKTTDHDLNAIQPMRNLINEFIKVVSESAGIGTLEQDYIVTNHARWGTFVTDSGHVKQVFNDHLSGCNLKIQIPFLKGSCANDTILINKPAPSYVLDTDGNIVATLYANETYTTTDDAPVTIKNIMTGATIEEVPSGGEYEVEVLTEIVDTIDSNTSTIIDPIN